MLKNLAISDSTRSKWYANHIKSEDMGVHIAPTHSSTPKPRTAKAIKLKAAQAISRQLLELT
jgi:hypothetical protein